MRQGIRLAVYRPSAHADVGSLRSLGTISDDHFDLLTRLKLLDSGPAQRDHMHEYVPLAVGE
jgi:hypothetical protein